MRRATAFLFLKEGDVTPSTDGGPSLCCSHLVLGASFRPKLTTALKPNPDLPENQPALHQSGLEELGLKLWKKDFFLGGGEFSLSNIEGGETHQAPPEASPFYSLKRTGDSLLRFLSLKASKPESALWVTHHQNIQGDSPYHCQQP